MTANLFTASSSRTSSSDHADHAGNKGTLDKARPPFKTLSLYLRHLLPQHASPNPGIRRSFASDFAMDSAKQLTLLSRMTYRDEVAGPNTAALSRPNRGT
ncbi:hypothetical protein IM739_15975 [Rhizobium sp. SL42]|nr:hypothetical protein IM739_15975 [Rhizobium sp. SL42]